MNNVSLIGRLTKDIELKYTAGTQTAVAKFSIAMRRDEKNSDFIPVTAFGKQAENLEKYCKKGSQIGVTGRLQSDSYEGKNGKVYTLEVISNGIEFLTPKGTTTEETKSSDPVPPAFEEIEEDIPF